MLHFGGPDGLIEARSRAAAPVVRDLELAVALREHWRGVAICVGLSLAAATTIIVMTQPVYVASARVLFDPRRGDTFRQAPEREYSIDTAQLESQIQLLKSEQISRPVIDAHRLEQDDEFSGPRSSLKTALRGLIFSEKEPRSGSYAGVLSAFDQQLDVRRLGQSYVLQISFQSTNADKAAKLANAVTASYLSRQIATRIDNAQRSSQFERPIKELGLDGLVASEAIATGKIDIKAFPAADARVISAALAPAGASAPRTTLILAFAGLLGLFAGVMFAVLRSQRRKIVRQRSHIERELGVGYIGSLRSVTVKRRGAQLAGLDQWGFNLMASSPSAPAAIDLRSIRTAFEMTSGQPGVQCIGVTSCHVGEGKSVAAYGMAMAFAAAGHKTLLVDANPRNATLTQRLSTHLKTRSTSGFVQAFGGEAFGSAISPTHVPSLSFMPIGHDFEAVNFSDLFETPASRDVFKRLRQHYSRVVFDLPDFLSLPDAWAIGSLIDCYIIVMAAGRTSQADAASMIAALKYANASIAGVVLNEHGS